MKYNRICQILGIEKPVIQGPLSWLTDARLVAAVSNAGGLGVLGPNAGLTAETAVSTPEETAEKMREEIRKTKKLTEKPFGVNLIPTPENDIWTPPILQVIKEEGVKAVVYTGYGEGAIITSLFNELKASGIAIIYRDINPTPENTRYLLLFRTLPDYYRSLPGKLADKLVSMDKAGASNEELAQTMGGLRGLRIGMLEGNTDEGYIALGTGIGNIRSIKSVAEVVNELAIC
ncbi:nitronate monooxygenase [Salmonella enterica]|nr:nitronate monooxygenase [Salmonella enterica]ECU9959595.1 nitronate monooxygenase [Salmonella enterica subsp. enterica serovar Poona]EDL4774271.1 hypothetical protein [Salmonella enterica subsp. enterica serovar Poona]EDL5836241.1 hypothetical protein [Salmonella enterica subsp. enterica serovar Poona]EDU6771811.1 nitronate monooxygenase [Salmonella enterica]